MPIARVRLEDGRIARFEVAEDATEAEILALADSLPPLNATASGTGEFGSMDSAAEIPGLEEPYPPKQRESLSDKQTGGFIMTPSGSVRREAEANLIGGAETAAAIATGATTGLGGQVRGTLMQAGREMASGEFGSREAANRIQKNAEEVGAEYTYQPRSERGQEMTQDFAGFASHGAAFTPMIGPTPRLGPIKPAANRAVDVAGESKIAQTVDDMGVVLTEKGVPFSQRGAANDAGAVSLFREQPYNMANAEILVQGPKGAERIIPDKLATSVTKQGWKPGVVAAIKAGSDVDRAKGLQMLERYKAGQVNELDRSTRRPTDVIGQTIDSRIKFLVNTMSESGKEIRRISINDMKKQPVAYEPVITSFEQSLNDLGVSIVDRKGKKVVNLKGSDIEGDGKAAKILNTVLSRMYETNTPRNASDVHRLKEYLDTQIDYGSNPQNKLTNRAERIIKDLRRGLNTVLGDKFPAYKAANERYSDSIGALNDLQKGVGTSIKLDGDNVASALGTASRKLTSNYATRVNLMDSLELLDQVAAKHGMKINDSVINQVIMANEIDRMFGATADTSLKGIMQQVERGVDIARGDALTAGLSMAKEGFDRARGINEANAIKAMEELLRRKMDAEDVNTLPARSRMP
jgi:hypothetical protein